ncbi:MAG TPA: hypothetical protein VER55_01695 [Ardenticatenaceae bacterium]|nr:hypothetical protein [Ardenticatenaceae bacterium]
MGQALPLNTFDVLSGDNWDEVLYSSRQTPRPLVNFDPPGAPWPQVVAARQALLDANPASADPLSPRVLSR